MPIQCSCRFGRQFEKNMHEPIMLISCDNCYGPLRGVLFKISRDVLSYRIDRLAVV